MSPASSIDSDPSASRSTSESSFFTTGESFKSSGDKTAPADFLALKRIAAFQMPHHHSAFPGQSNQLPVSIDFNVASHPKFPHLKIFQHRGKPAQMIQVRMGQRHHIDPLNPSRPQIRRHHVFSHVHSRVHPPL